MKINSKEQVEEYVQENAPAVIVGVDEAGRGPWAGPIVAAAVAVPPDWKPPPSLDDSKKLTRKTIQKLFRENQHVKHSIGVVHADEIDRIGLNTAQALAQGKAVEALFSGQKLFVVVDGIVPPTVRENAIERLMLVPKADALIPAVSLASVFAKATQLRFMAEFDKKYPEYDFKNNAGYGGSKKHRQALEKFGVCEIHRRSFGPIRKILAEAQFPKRSWELPDE
jgi:ribonuclease HII